MIDFKKLIRSFRYAFEGLYLAVKVDQNVRFHLIVGTLVILSSLLLKTTLFEFLFIIFAIFFVIICEMVNTAIEEMTNLIKLEHSQEAKIAKDIAAASVFLSAVFAFIVGSLILVPKLLNFISQ